VEWALKTPAAAGQAQIRREMESTHIRTPIVFSGLIETQFDASRSKTRTSSVLLLSYDLDAGQLECVVTLRTGVPRFDNR
jgi:hypothetical protein